MPRHALSDLRVDEQRADCAVCGPDIEVYVAPNRIQCRVKRREEKRTSSAARRARKRPATPAKRRGGPGAARTAEPHDHRRQWRRRIKALYGLTLADWDRMLFEQSGRCATCTAVTEHLYVDHCHASGRVRGLLCLRCNSALGWLEDDVERLDCLRAYLTA